MTSPIKAFVFDVYGTLFDVVGIKEECEKWFPGDGEGISEIWRTKQVEYFMLRQLMEDYETLYSITRRALRYTLKLKGLPSSEQIEQQLLNAYLHLPLYDEVEAVLTQLSGERLVVLSNGSLDMLDPLLINAGLKDFFSEVLSIDAIGQFKPVPASYNYAKERLGLQSEEILFISSNGWDVSGAKNVGFQTAWINRKSLPVEELSLNPDFVFEDLKGLLKWAH